MSLPPMFVGWKVPETRGPESGNGLPAESLSVIVTLLAEVAPPTSDIMIAFCPSGPTSRMSTSSGNTWLKLLSVTVTVLTVPVTPEIDMLDGYGEATPPAGIVIEVGLHPLGQVPLTVTVKLQLPPGPPAEAVHVTVVTPVGKKEPEAGEQVTVPQSPLVVGAEYVTTAPQLPGEFSAVTFPGQVKTQASAGTVVIFKHQPPPILPRSPLESSFTYRLQVPFGGVPVKTLNAEAPDGAGAGAGNISAPSTTSVGLNVPLASGPPSDRLLAAASSRVMVNPLTALPPPTSERMMAFCPPGPTRSISTSSGNAWLKLFRVTVTVFTNPVLPEIEMFEG